MSSEEDKAKIGWPAVAMTGIILTFLGFIAATAPEALIIMVIITFFAFMVWTT